ncbi:MAG: prepilin peptidase [Lachnospiraceae bacterium]|nr:prepilin peptidase [Lachnospiraceae bacterium]
MISFVKGICFLLVSNFCISVSIQNINERKQRAENQMVYNRLQWYFVVILEVLTLLLAIVIGFNKQITIFTEIQYCVVWIFLVSSAIFDIQIRIIPNFIPLALLGAKIILVILQLIGKQITWSDMIVNLFVAIICIIILLVISKITHDGIGMGDVKLLAAIGFVLGLELLWAVLLLSSLLCLLVAIILLISKTKTLKDSLPFAPFIMFGYMISITLYIV